MDNFKPFNLWFLTAWFGAAITCLIFSILFSFYLSTSKILLPINQNFKLYAALPSNSSELSDSVISKDARSKIIENFLRRYNSPLAEYGDDFVSVADKYNLDYRLLPSIAMQESNGGKKIINDSYNPFGYGIYTGSVIKFSSWEQAIERVGKALREDYINLGLRSPEQIMTKYTPPSLALGGTWAKGVSSFMVELR